MNSSTASLYPLLEEALGGKLQSVRRFADRIHQMACSYLKVQKSRHYELFNYIGSDVDSFAWDAVADLFSQKEEPLQVFGKWFAELGNTLSPTEFEMECRRRVFRQINDHIFYCYQKWNPSLFKIIRNIKRCVRDELSNELIIDETSQILRLKQHTAKASLIEAHILHIRLAKRIKQAKHIPDVVRAVRDLFRYYEGEAVSVSVNDLAILILEADIDQHEEVFATEVASSSLLHQKDVALLVKQAIKKSSRTLHLTYVKKQKLSPQEFNACIKALEAIFWS